MEDCHFIYKTEVQATLLQDSAVESVVVIAETIEHSHK